MSVQLRFETADGTISGVVYFPGQSGPSPLAEVPVWAYADAGQHLMAATDGQGRYTLQVTIGNAWHVGAAYPPTNSLSYYAAESEVAAPEGGSVTADLHLALADDTLSPVVTASFEPAVGWTDVLTDGTRIEIPAGAMPVTDTVDSAVIDSSTHEITVEIHYFSVRRCFHGFPQVRNTHRIASHGPTPPFSESFRSKDCLALGLEPLARHSPLCAGAGCSHQVAYEKLCSLKLCSLNPRTSIRTPKTSA
jgi:hypothetical protein